MDPIRRLTDELWRDDEIASTTPDPGAGWDDHAIVESGETMVLVPLQPRRSAAAAFLRWTDAMSPRDTARRIAAWGGVRVGVDGPLFTRTVAIRTGGDEPTLHDHLAAALGQSSVAVSGTFGPPRPNQKPVLRVFDPRGKTVAFAKVGWNDLTRDLVVHEAEFLASPGAGATKKLVLPRTLSVLTWRDRLVALSEPLLGRPRLRNARPPGADVLAEVAALADTYITTIAESQHLRRCLAASAGMPDTANVIQTIAERWGSVRLPYGRWHGDWTPWNMSTEHGRLIVWDWERTAADTPVGFDALHHTFQRRLGESCEPPITEFVDSVMATAPTLRLLGVGADAVPALACLYILELELRFGGPDHAPEQDVPWMHGLLTETVRHFIGR